MDKNSILAFNNKESVSDVLNELLRSGAQKLIHNAVEAELREFMSQHQGVTEDGKVSVIRNGYLPKREILTGIGPVIVHCTYSQGTLERWRGTNFSFRIGSALRSKNEIPGGGITLAVPQRCIYRRNGRSLKSAGRA